MFGLTTWLGVGAGVVVALVLGWGYNVLIDNPSVVRETTAIVEAAARERTFQAIGEVTDAAQRARAMRRYCLDSGRLYDFKTGECG
jgi:hypothetical protein